MHNSGPSGETPQDELPDRPPVGCRSGLVGAWSFGGPDWCPRKPHRSRHEQPQPAARLCVEPRWFVRQLGFGGQLGPRRSRLRGCPGWPGATAWCAWSRSRCSCRSCPSC